MEVASNERRRYPRVQAPIVYSPMGLLHHRRATRDVSQGGFRAYADDVLHAGERLEVELWLPDRTSVRCWVRVQWVQRLVDASEARYDVGFQFIDIADADVQRLATVLRRE
jgi:c-di-GMP-binding flagellar brake protein YcgR